MSRRDEKPAKPGADDKGMPRQTFERLMRRALSVKPPTDDKPPAKRKPRRKRSGLSGA